MKTGTISREATIRALFDDWAIALESRDAGRVAALYEPDAVFLPTFSNVLRRSPEEVRPYFEEFLLAGPSARLIEGHVREMGNVAVHSGIYRFTMTAMPDRSEMDARFTFVYQRIDQRWGIVAHHSSAMPES